MILIGELDSAQFSRYDSIQSHMPLHLLFLLTSTSVADVTTNLSFAAATIINSPSTAISQIDRTLDVMMYENKPVYIGLSLAVAGQIISLTQTPSTSGSDASQQYASASPSAYYTSAADASESFES